MSSNKLKVIPSNGDSEDCYGKAYEMATKMQPDMEGAFHQLEKASQIGDGRALYALGTWYLRGNEPIVRPSRRKAIQYLRRASEAGVAEAMYDLAVCYEKGFGVKKSMQRAFEYYSRAALAGDFQSYYEIGRMYYHGIGVQRNRKLADIWLDKAKELGIND